MSWLHFRDPASAWTHFLWFVLSFPAGWVLLASGASSALKRVGVLVFGGSLVFCYAGSWLYHSVPPSLARPFKTLDHIGIYLLIAGTTTPIALVVLRGWWRWGMLTGIWALALAGIILRLTTPLPIRVMTFFYLGMGWVGSCTWFELAKHLTSARLRPLWIGGLFYSIGAVCNSLRWPNLMPGVFGSHEVFHVFVMAGSAWHYYFILSSILPYQPLPEVEPVSRSVLAVEARKASEAVVQPG